jgi:galactokinase
MSAGMSSSAALEVGFSFAFKELFGLEFTNEEWAKIGQGVENNYMGLKTGLLDQFSSIFGKKNELILSDFRTVEVLRTVAVPPGYSFVVANSMVKHDLVDSEDNVRREDCENAAAKLNKVYAGAKTLRDITPAQLEESKALLSVNEYKRAAHVVGECDRVKQAVAALDNNDVATFGKLLFESHESSKVNFENSTVELDYLVELAKSLNGCLGSRLSGGGFGGISIHLVENSKIEEYTSKLAAAFKLQVGVDPQIIVCEIGQGAEVVKL